MSTAPFVAAAAVVTAADLLKAGADIAFGGAPQYIRDGQPIGPVGQLGLGAARAICRRYAENPTGIPADTAANYENACRPYLQSVGYGAGPSAATTTGGQCPGVAYGARYTWRSTGTGGTTVNYTPAANQFLSPGTTLFGPITYLGRVPGGTGGGPGTSNQNIFAVRGFTAGGLPITRALNRGGAATSFSLADNISGLAFERLDGGTECGDGGLNYEPPIPPTTPDGPTFVFAPSADVNVGIGVLIAPNGLVTVNIGTGPITIDPFAGDGDGGGGGGAPSPGDIGEPGTDIVTGAGGDAEGEAPPGSVLVGLKIALETIPLTAREYTTGVFRGVCYVYMGVPGNLDQDFAGALLRDGQFIYAEQDFLTAWRVYANPGYNLRVVPYYREV